MKILLVYELSSFNSLTVRLCLNIMLSLPIFDGSGEIIELCRMAKEIRKRYGSIKGKNDRS